MAALALDFTYRYPYPSAVIPAAAGKALSLATCSAAREHPHFFEGRLQHPREVAEMLLVLTTVVRTHFFLQRPANLDPVVTSNEGVL